MTSKISMPCAHPNSALQKDLDQYEGLVRNGLLDQLLNILESDDPLNLCFDARIYTNLAFSWKDQTYSTAKEIKSNVLKDPNFLRIFEATILCSVSPATWEEAVCAIGRIAACDDGFRDCILKSGAGILNAMVSRCPRGDIRNPPRAVDTTVSTFKKLIQRDPLPDWDLIYPIFFIAAVLTPNVPDDREGMLSDLCWIVYYLSSGVYGRRRDIINENIFRRLKLLLNHPSGKVRLPVIYVFRRILAQDGSLAPAVFDYDILFGLFSSIHSPRSLEGSTIRHETANLILAIISSPIFGTNLAVVRDSKAKLDSCIHSFKLVVTDQRQDGYSSSPTSDTVIAVVRLVYAIGCLVSSNPPIGKSFLSSRTPELLGYWLLMETSKGSSARDFVLELILGSLYNFMAVNDLRPRLYARLLGVEDLMASIRSLQDHNMRNIRHFSQFIESSAHRIIPPIVTCDQATGTSCTALAHHNTANALSYTTTEFPRVVPTGANTSSSFQHQHRFRLSAPDSTGANHLAQNAANAQQPGVALKAGPPAALHGVRWAAPQVPSGDPKAIQTQQADGPFASGPPDPEQHNTTFVRWVAPMGVTTGS